MNARPATPLHIEKDQAGADLVGQLGFAVVLLVLLILQQVYLPIGWEFDLRSPDFNPLIALPLLMIGLLAWSLAKAGLNALHLRRFGAVTMELFVRAPLAQGEVCRGRVRTEQSLKFTGDCHITLRCLEGYRDREIGEAHQTTDRMVYTTAWEETQTVPAAGADSSTGLAFEFRLPVREPLKPFIEAPVPGGRPHSRSMTIMSIPFLKRKVMTQNVKPDARQWWLEARASTEKGGFRARFRVPVQEKSRYI